MNRYTTLSAVQALQNETWMYAFIVAAIALAISTFVANLIAWQGGQDKSYQKRRLWFALIGIISLVSFFLYNDLQVKPLISQQGWQAMFSKTNIQSSIVGLFVYYVVGVVIMFICRHSKFGSILGKEKGKK